MDDPTAEISSLFDSLDDERVTQSTRDAEPGGFG
jgi:hypothetical protein